MSLGSWSAHADEAAAADKSWVRQQVVTSAFAFEVLVFAEEDDRFGADGVRIIDRRRASVVQEILNAGGMGVLRPADRLLSVVDANFDGHPDLVLAFADGGAGPNNTDHFYIFNPKTGRFEFDEQLSDMTQVQIHRNGTITSASRGGCCQHSSETYLYVRGALTQVASWDEAYTADGRWIVTTVGRLRNGKWHQTTKRVRQPPERFSR